MTVTRIQPSASYVQDELRRIQDALANAIDNVSTTATKTSSDLASTSQVMIADMGTFYLDSAYVSQQPGGVNSWIPLVRPVCIFGSTGYAAGTMPAVFSPGFDGYIVSLNVYASDQNNTLVSGKSVQFQVYLNGDVMDRPLTLTVSGPGCDVQQTGDSRTTFTSNDELAVYIKASSTTITQGFSASLVIAKDS